MSAALDMTLDDIIKNNNGEFIDFPLNLISICEDCIEEADPDLKPKLNNIIIQQLDDAAGDFSGLALKCLSPLVRKMNEPRVVEMCSQLCDKILSRTLGHCC
ncbi:unnamed protein product [Trifolium pratense]|uniref:Uncharacterized protein n=1 Tax=Trifolium pratense TaxID=57577 RepID=A0ACB0JL61_TRIPR|nr:unnamed protein product [Trifolium pratense]